MVFRLVPEEESLLLAARDVEARELVVSVSLAESRYDRQERVSWWEQRRLAAARVLVVGAGALGNEVVKNLVLVGVGDIVVADMDVVEASNLARCVFFRSSDEGRFKSVVLAERAAELNPDVKVAPLVGDVRSLGTGLAWRADVIVGALDNREARLYVNRVAARTRRVWVDGAIEALHGVARVFEPPVSCYECTMTELDWQVLAHRQSCRLLSREDLADGKVPTTATTSSVVAGVQAQEVVKLLHADQPGVQSLRGGLVFDGANNDSYPVTYPTSEECMAHFHCDDPVVLDVGGAARVEVTLADVAAAAWPGVEGTGEARLVVDLGDDYVLGWRCLGCGVDSPDGRPAVLVSFGEARCEHCGDSRMPELVASAEVPGPLAGATLADLGVRTDEVLVVRRGLEERFVWLACPDQRLPASWSTPRPAAP
jgi:adenylyltransferase/sulfurtransferase